jgi:hypothetical protein
LRAKREKLNFTFSAIKRLLPSDGLIEERFSMMKPQEHPTSEERLTLAALGEIFEDRLAPEDSREELQELAEVVGRLEALYGSHEEAASEVEGPSEFQIARMGHISAFDCQFDHHPVRHSLGFQVAITFVCHTSLPTPKVQ